MRRKSIKLGVFGACLVISASLLFGCMFLDRSAMASSQTVTVSIPAQQDSYVHSGYGTSNYGGQDWFILGAYLSDWAEAYFTFNFTTRPTGWSKAEIWLDFYHVSSTLNVSLSQVTEAWGEYTINWINQPAHGTLVSSFLVAVEQIYTIDVTSFVAGTNLSVCVNASDFTQTGYVQGTAREGAAGTLFQVPRLVWYYTREVPDIPGYNAGFLFVAIAAGVLAVAFRRGK